jgi:dolichol-phosphate mannosyltransferase
MPSLQVSVIVPLYNEEDNVPEMQQQLAAALSRYSHEIILVDDGSTDQTASRVNLTPGTRLIQFGKNSGQSAAMYVGIMAAQGDVIVMLDGDLQNDPADIPKLVDKLNEPPGYDLVCGYRAKRKDTPFKRLQSRIANAVRSRFIGDGVRDTGCSLKALRREAREALMPFNGMHRFIPAFIRRAGYRITEIPVNHRPRIHGVSKYHFLNRAFRATRDMFGVSWLLTRQLNLQNLARHETSSQPKYKK